MEVWRRLAPVFFRRRNRRDCPTEDFPKEAAGKRMISEERRRRLFARPIQVRPWASAWPSAMTSTEIKKNGPET